MGIHSKTSLYVCLCVSEIDSLWPGCINSLPDWLQLSRNVIGEPERDLIAIRELPSSGRGQRARCRNNPRKHPSLCERGRGLQLSGWELLISQGVFNRWGGRECGQTRWPDELYFHLHYYSAPLTFFSQHPNVQSSEFVCSEVREMYLKMKHWGRLSCSIMW